MGCTGGKNPESQGTTAPVATACNLSVVILSVIFHISMYFGKIFRWWWIPDSDGKVRRPRECFGYDILGVMVAHFRGFFGIMIVMIMQFLWAIIFVLVVF